MKDIKTEERRKKGEKEDAIGRKNLTSRAVGEKGVRKGLSRTQKEGKKETIGCGG